MTLTWTQPCCRDCYAQMFPGRTPFRFLDAELEQCAWCLDWTEDGIYVRADPRTVPYPREKEA